MSFTSYELLQSRMDSNQLDVLKGEGSELAEAIAEADETIFAYTGKTPGAANHRLLVGIASDIVIWIISGRQTQIDEHEIDRRRTNYTNAISTLTLIRDGKIRIGSAAAVTDPITPTVSCGESRMANY